MEKLRMKLAQDPNIYPEYFKIGRSGDNKQHGSSRDSSPSVISIASSSSPSPTVMVAPASKARPIVISSDDEDENPLPPPRKVSQSNPSIPPFMSRSDNLTSGTLQQAFPKPPAKVSPAVPIQIPANGHRPPPTVNPTWETFDEPDTHNLYEPKTTAAEAETALRALVQDTVNNDDDIEIDMSQAIVEGFRDGITLLPHQVLGRTWMRERETGKKFGGVLADDMGLGKTIQTLARIVDGRARKADKVDGWAASTLVVCPVSLVSQWASEIQKMAIGLRVIEHHGASRSSDPTRLQQAHVVVTSYSILASEYGAFKPDVKDETSKKSKAKAKKAASGSNSDDDDTDSSSEPFGKTLAKKKPATKTKAKDALFRINWFRIVLDEAHNIKNRNTKAALACCALEGKFRWCLTGTPMQNSVEELYSLIKFLRIRPLSDWHTFNEQINKPVKSGRATRAMKRLQVVLKAIMLRRRKDHVLNGKAILQLPARKVEIVACEFDKDEEAFYSALENKMSTELDKLVQADMATKSYTHVLLMLLRLRQACNHPSLVSKDYRVDREAAEPKAAKGDDDDADDLTAMFGQMGVSNGKKCEVCQTVLNSSNLAETSDTHCNECAVLAAKAKLKSAVSGPNDLPPDSAKIRKLLSLLQGIDDRSNGEEKTIIFSQFTSMLDLIEPFLAAKGIKYVRYDGSMSKDKREASLEKIRNSNSTRLILISFKAGSTGLNLTACNNVILVDMWWNPALEEQAFDRAHRFGQTRDVNIFKLTIEKTVEARILELQEKKRALSTAALSGDKLKNMKLGMDDLMALFRHGGRDDDDDDDD